MRRLTRHDKARLLGAVNRGELTLSDLKAQIGVSVFFWQGTDPARLICESTREVASMEDVKTRSSNTSIHFIEVKAYV